MLRAHEIEHHHRDGFIVPSRLYLGECECEQLRLGQVDVLAADPDFAPDRLDNVHLNGGATVGRQRRWVLYSVGAVRWCNRRASGALSGA